VNVDQVIEAVRVEMTRRRVTQRDLERQFGWGHSYLSSVLAGRTELKVKTLFKILEAMDISPAQFLARIEGVDLAQARSEPQRLVRAEQLEDLFELLQKAGKVAETLSQKNEPLKVAQGRGGG